MEKNTGILASTIITGAIMAGSGLTTEAQTSEAIRPFRINIPEKALSDLQQRVKATKWPDRETVKDQSQGVQLATMQALAKYWVTEYNWRNVEARLNALPQFAAAPVINVPSITLEGDANGAPHPDSSVYAKKFSGRYAHRVINGGLDTICRRMPQKNLPTLSLRLIVFQNDSTIFLTDFKYYS